MKRCKLQSDSEVPGHSLPVGGWSDPNTVSRYFQFYNILFESNFMGGTHSNKSTVKAVPRLRSNLAVRPKHELSSLGVIP